jgi:hypothetical protein
VPIEFGKNGYYFLETGETSWLDISKRIGETGLSQGVFKSGEPKEFSPEDFAKALNISFFDPHLVEVVWGSKYAILKDSFLPFCFRS